MEFVLTGLLLLLLLLLLLPRYHTLAVDDELAPCAYDESWSSLSLQQRQSAQLLGMTSEDFMEESPAASTLSMSPTTPTSADADEKRQAAAQLLGTTRENFMDEPSPADSMLSQSRPTPTSAEAVGSVQQMQNHEYVLSITCASSETVTAKKQYTQYVLHVTHRERAFVIKKRWAELYDDLGTGLSRIRWKQSTGLRWDDHRPKMTLAKKLFSSNNNQQEIDRRISEINSFLGSVSWRCTDAAAWSVLPMLTRKGIIN